MNRFFNILLCYCLCIFEANAFKIDLLGHKVLSYDRDGIHYGCKDFPVDSYAIHYKNVMAAISTVHFHTNVVFVKFIEATVDLLDSLIVEHQVAGILFILPDDFSEILPQQLEMMKQLEFHIMTHSFDCFMYFVVDDHTLSEVYDVLINDNSNSFKVIGKYVTSKVIKNPSLYNFQGWASGNSNSNGELPTIALISHYDTFSILPTFGSGIDHSGSGTIALLEIMRFMSNLMNYDEGSKPNYNLLFLLLDGGSMNYIGAEQWLAKASNSLLDSIEFALCLDSISQSNELSLYISRPPKTDELKRIYDVFEKTSKYHNIKFQVVHKKIQVGKEEMRFEHERFGYNRIASGTVSNIELTDDEHKKETSIFDKTLDKTQFVNNIRFLTDCLLHIIYPLNEDISILSNEFNISRINVERLIDIYNNTDNSIMSFTKNHLLIKGIHDIFTDNCNEMSMETVEFKTDYIFYTPASIPISILTVKGPFMELGLFFVSVCYLYILKLAIDFIYSKTIE